MNKFSKLTGIMLTALVVSFTGCGLDEEPNLNPPAGSGDVSIRGSIESTAPKTRTSIGDGVSATDGSFEVGDQIGIYVKNGVAEGDQKYVSQNVPYTSAVGDIPWTVDDANKLFWTELGLGDSDVASEFSAYYPYVSTAPSTGVTTNAYYPFTVKPDQDVRTPDGLSFATNSIYEQNDLLHAGPLKTKGGVVDFVFKHLMSRVSINLTSTDYDFTGLVSTSALKGQTSTTSGRETSYRVKIVNIDKTASIDLLTGEIGALTSGFVPEDSIIPRLIGVDATNKMLNFAAIVMPQVATSSSSSSTSTFKIGSPFIIVEILEPGKPLKEYKYNVPARISGVTGASADFKGLNSGEQFVLNLRVDKSGVTITGEKIAAWGTLGTDDAEFHTIPGIYSDKEFAAFSTDWNAYIAGGADAPQLADIQKRWCTNAGGVVDAAAAKNTVVNIWRDIDMSAYNSGDAFKNFDAIKGFKQLTFNGNGYKISNLKYSVTIVNAALFTDLGDDANAPTIKNVRLAGFEMTGTALAAALASDISKSATIENCVVTGGTYNAPTAGGLIASVAKTGVTVTACGAVAAATKGVTGTGSAGGLIGSSQATVNDCYSTLDVLAGTTAGGLIGEVAGGSVINSYAKGGVTPAGGGLVGKVTLGTVLNCYAQTASTTAAGLIGETAAAAIVNNCYATGGVTENALIKTKGAGSVVTYCYWGKDVTQKTSPDVTCEPFNKTTGHLWNGTKDKTTLLYNVLNYRAAMSGTNGGFNVTPYAGKLYYWNIGNMPVMNGKLIPAAP